MYVFGPVSHCVIILDMKQGLNAHPDYKPR